jgi:hypothetical protein
MLGLVDHQGAVGRDEIVVQQNKGCQGGSQPRPKTPQECAQPDRQHEGQHQDGQVKTLAQAEQGQGDQACTQDRQQGGQEAAFSLQKVPDGPHGLILHHIGEYDRLF